MPAATGTPPIRAAFGFSACPSLPRGAWRPIKDRFAVLLVASAVVEAA